MKLHNKEFDEIFEVITFGYKNSDVPNGNGDYPVESISLEVMDEDGDVYEYKYRSLEDLNAVWGDYNTAEPLIKNKEVRKAIREWAAYNGVREVYYFTDGEGGSRLDAHTVTMGFYNELRELKDWEKYTIAELCGKGEE